jgi:hypothetical protein
MAGIGPCADHAAMGRKRASQVKINFELTLDAITGHIIFA